MERQSQLVAIRNCYIICIIKIYNVALRRIYNIEGNISCQAVGKLGRCAVKMLRNIYACPSRKSVLLYHRFFNCGKNFCLRSILRQGDLYGLLIVLNQILGVVLVLGNVKYYVNGYVVHSHIELNGSSIEDQGISYRGCGALEFIAQRLNQKVQSNIVSSRKIFSYKSLALGLPSAVCHVLFQEADLSDDQFLVAITNGLIFLIAGKSYDRSDVNIQNIAQAPISEHTNKVCRIIQGTVITCKCVQALVGIKELFLNSLQIIYQELNLGIRRCVFLGYNGKIQLSVVSVKLSQELGCRLDLTVLNTLVRRVYGSLKLHRHYRRVTAELNAVFISILSEQLQRTLNGSIGIVGILRKLLC